MIYTLYNHKESPNRVIKCEGIISFFSEGIISFHIFTSGLG